jgi:hypothetical protein
MYNFEERKIELKETPSWETTYEKQKAITSTMLPT